MRTCRSCGRQNANETDFCACGEYLRWEPTNYVEAVAAPPESARSSDDRAQSGDNRPPEPGQLDPNITLAGDGAGSVAGEPPPGAAALTLRLPGEDGVAEGVVSVSVEPGARVTILGLIRNQSDVVDNFDLSVRGLPEDWWTVAPATAYLVPYGTSGSYEQEIQIHIHPPRSPEAKAKAWAFEVVAVSRSYGREVAASPASVTVGPYFDIATELRPERASGRLKARYRLTVHNKANARTEVALVAEDTDAECRFRFAEPSIALEAGNAIECPFTVFPPKQIWIGRKLERRFQVTAKPIGVELVQPPRMAVYRQGAWLPWWLLIVAPIVAVLAVVAIKLLPKETMVPNLKGQPSVFAAQKLLNKLGLQLAPKPTWIVNAAKPAGSIADQSPAAGKPAKKGAVVTVAVFTGTGQVPVPAIVGDTPGLADQALLTVHLALGTVSPQPLDPNGKISAQLPLAGTTVPSGTAIAVFLAPLSAPGGKARKVGAAAGAAGVGAAAAAGAAAGAATPASVAAAAAQAGGGPIAIPALHGDPTAAADKLSRLGLVPIPIKRPSTAPLGQVAGTIPAAGAKVAKGAKVDLLISSAPPLLAYDDGNAVRVIDSVTRKPAGQVPAGVGPQVEAAWSPDGTQLVYSQNGPSPNSAQLMLLQPAVKNAQPSPLTPLQDGVVDENPSYAPTLTLKAPVIAFVRRIIRPGSTQTKVCFGTIGTFALHPDCTAASGWDLGGQVNWSPKGSIILVLGTQNAGHNFGLLAFTSNVPFSTHASDWGQPTLETVASVAGQGVFAGAFSPDGKQMALVSNQGLADYFLYVVPAGNFNLSPKQKLPVRACQVSWAPDSKTLAVMQPGVCGPNATGTIVVVDPTNPFNLTTLVTSAAHPAWQPVATGG